MQGWTHRNSTPTHAWVEPRPKSNWPLNPLGSSGVALFAFPVPRRRDSGRTGLAAFRKLAASPRARLPPPARGLDSSLASGRISLGAARIHWKFGAQGDWSEPGKILLPRDSAVFAANKGVPQAVPRFRALARSCWLFVEQQCRSRCARYQSEGNFVAEDVSRLYREAEQLRAEWLLAMDAFGNLVRGEYEAAVATFSQWAALEPINPAPYVARGIAHFNAGKDASADADRPRSGQV